MVDLFIRLVCKFYFKLFVKSLSFWPLTNSWFFFSVLKELFVVENNGGKMEVFRFNTDYLISALSGFPRANFAPPKLYKFNQKQRRCVRVIRNSISVLEITLLKDKRDAGVIHTHKQRKQATPTKNSSP